MFKNGNLVGKQCPNSLTRKEKEKALIGLINQSFMPLYSQDERELFGSPNRIYNDGTIYEAMMFVNCMPELIPGNPPLNVSCTGEPEIILLAPTGFEPVFSG